MQQRATMKPVELATIDMLKAASKCHHIKWRQLMRNIM